jgi:thioredoxin 1
MNIFMVWLFADRVLDRQGGNAMKGYKRAARSLILTSIAITAAILLTPKINRTNHHGNTSDMLLLQAPATFKREVLDHKGPVVVDFFADWCPACRTMMPVFQQTASKLKRHHIKFVAVNVEKFPEAADSLGFDSIPAVAFFNHGKQVGSVHTGALPATKFEALVLERFNK